MASKRYGPRRQRDRPTDEHRKQRRRALQARHRATLVSLFESLKAVVCPHSNKTPAKWKILDHAKGFLREQEAYLSKLLQLKATFLSNESGPCSLEEVQEEYRNLYFNQGRQGPSCKAADGEEGPKTSEEDSAEEVTDESLPSQSSINSVPDILEFEGYLLFYRQTVELLVHYSVLSSSQTGLAVVSEAISGLWNSLSPERRALYQSCPLDQGPPTWAEVRDSQVHLSQADSQGATASSASTYEEDLLQDAYDVVKKEMDPTVSIPTDSPIAVPQPSQCNDIENLQKIYTDIMGFIKTKMVEKPAVVHGVSQSSDYEDFYLRCSESIDSED
ncbi:stimulated by retinoic acid gene 8 protein homolog [Aplochiton taeniatus]